MGIHGNQQEFEGQAFILTQERTCRFDLSHESAGKIKHKLEKRESGTLDIVAAPLTHFARKIPNFFHSHRG
jgi:hypothetical protein